MYAIGLGVHAMASAVFGLVHAGILHAIGVTSVGRAAAWDLLIGGVHGSLAFGVVTGALYAAFVL